MPATFFIKADQLGFNRGRQVLFADLSFLLEAGQLLVIQGENGAGKTTLLRCLAGMNSDYKGRIDLQGERLFIGHSAGLSEALSPTENLCWYGTLRGLKQKPSMVCEALAHFGLRGLEESPCSLLSAGQKRRVLLSRLLLEPAKIWLLDEPATRLDASGNELFWELCASHIQHDGLVVLSTHQLAEPLSADITIKLGNSEDLERAHV